MISTETQPVIDTSDVLGLCAHDLICYGTAMYPRFQAPAHVELLASTLERMERGEVRRLLVSLPPRHSKSTICSELFPAFAFGRDPSRSIILASYSQDLANGFGSRVRGHVGSALHSEIFPDCILSSDAQDKFSLTAGGQFFAVGRGSAVTGRGCDFLLIDDPLSGSEEARSENIRRALKEWYSRVAFTRLAPGGAIVVIATRWHADDLIGWLETEHRDQGWTTLCLPALAEANDPLGRAEGEALWPEKFPVAALEAARSQLGSAGFSALYQQRPTPEGGGIIKPFWWKYFVRLGDPVPEGCVVLPEKFDQQAISADLTFKASSTSDYVCMGVWGRVGVRKFLLDVVWDRLDFVDTKKAIISLSAKWPQAHTKFIESAANGPAIISELQSTISGLIPVNAIGSKAGRLSAASPDVEAGNVFLPHPSIAPWTRNFVEECAAACAGGKHDDAADMMSLAINQFRKRSGSVTVSELQL